MNAVELLHPALPELMDELLARNGWSWEAVTSGRVELNGEPVTVDSLQWFLITEDPVLWTETNLLNRPEDGEGFWTLFDYQKPSMRCRGHVVHQDGAEVGKSREIVALTLWCATALTKGSVLVGSARDGDLDEIWDEIQYQKSANPYLHSRVASQTTKPYRRITFDNGLKALFRPAGFDGQAFRGIHVGGLALHDEAVKVQNPTSWREFWRAAKPGCEIRLYSVPNGDRLCTFQRIADNAIPFEQVAPETSPKTIIASLLRAPGSALEGARKLSRDLGGRVWFRVHWPKTIMPAPFWSEERRQEYIGLFGSAEDPGYVHNVLGLPGDPECSVFPSRLLDPAVQYLPDYLSVSLVWDHHAKRIDVEVKRLNPSYSRQGDEEDEVDSEDGGAASASQPMLLVYKDAIDVSGFDSMGKEAKRDLVQRLISRAVRPIEGYLTCGVDFGSSSVTEIAVERGRETHQWVLRVSARGFGYSELSHLIGAMDLILQPVGGWGMDATGVGKAVVDLLQGEGDSLAKRISGFVFNQRTPALNEDGEPQRDPLTDEPRQLTWKEQGTQLLELALSTGKKTVPCDPDLIFLLQNHTYRESGGQRIYSKVNDHAVDAWRCAALRRLMQQYGAPGAPPLIVIPTGRQIDSMSFLRKM